MTYPELIVQYKIFIKSLETSPNTINTVTPALQTALSLNSAAVALRMTVQAGRPRVNVKRITRVTHRVAQSLTITLQRLKLDARIKPGDQQDV